jgi:hypothetical protein
MTPDLFLERVLGAADHAALRLAATPRDFQSAWLREFERRVRAQWRECFAPHLSEDDVTGMVQDVVAHVRKRLDFLERHEAGSA